MSQNNCIIHTKYFFVNKFLTHSRASTRLAAAEEEHGDKWEDENGETSNDEKKREG